jgi:hypothetical protein
MRNKKRRMLGSQCYSSKIHDRYSGKDRKSFYPYFY